MPTPKRHISLRLMPNEVFELVLLRQAIELNIRRPVSMHDALRIAAVAGAKARPRQLDFSRGEGEMKPALELERVDMVLDAACEEALAKLRHAHPDHSYTTLILGCARLATDQYRQANHAP